MAGGGQRAGPRHRPPRKRSHWLMVFKAKKKNVFNADKHQAFLLILLNFELHVKARKKLPRIFRVDTLKTRV